ncbi:MAG: YbaK/EbsC family protein [Salibaculum sp.]|jgi:prolyl-tRNA editing enzyme YbaK/EbsC (Cys-tRNA(Pro) deacylase)|uniref:YbaK/EbsC family protein n=1 Tax=Roseovarius halophilus (ex Wu et al. 2025) TaxID=3376060 RepID=UPI002870B355|nr:YbaK/EbsC family protein [Salibaculum sp.]MDR9427571.1 YbaK/EbsC family protein [Salibaculum sp.]MDR9481560.1 YbaK/EbsC family protein [Salibaculum sp.]
MSKSLNRVKAALQAAGLDADPLEMAEGTRTAEQAAAAAGCALDQICKSIIFQGHESGDCILFLTGGGNRVAAGKAARVAGEALDRADAAAVRAQTGFAIGGVAPIGHLHPIRAFWDPRLSDFAEIWAAAGTPRHVFAIAPDRLRPLAQAQVADFTA